MNSTKKYFISGHNGKAVNPLYTLLMVGIVMVFLGIVLSWFFIRTVDRLIFEQKIEPYVAHVTYHAKDHVFTNNRMENWQSEESRKHFEEFIQDINTSNEIKLLNVFSPKEILVFTTGDSMLGVEDRDEDILQAMSAGETVLKTIADKVDSEKIGLDTLSEVYIPIKSNTDEVVGVIEMYFDQSSLIALVRKLQFFVAVFIFISIGLIAGILYITIRKQNIQIIKQAKEISHIIEKAPIGIYTINKEGIIDSFNPKMVELSGAKEAGEVIGTNALELYTHKERGLDKLFREALGGKPFVVETPYISHVNKKETYRRYYGVPIFTHDNKTVEKLLVLVEDITEHKRLESELEKYNKGLEITVQARTKELQEKLKELSRLNEVMVGRELKMMELKKEIEKLKNLNSPQEPSQK